MLCTMSQLKTINQKQTSHLLYKFTHLLSSLISSSINSKCPSSVSLTSDLCLSRLSDPRYWSAHLGMLTQGSAKHVAEIQRIVVHEYYNMYTFDYDIALLQLKKPWPPSLGPLVQPVCLPPTSHAVTDSHRCLVTGWGYRTEEGEQRASLLTLALHRSSCRVMSMFLSPSLCRQGAAHSPAES